MYIEYLKSYLPQSHCDIHGGLLEEIKDLKPGSCIEKEWEEGKYTRTNRKVRVRALDLNANTEKVYCINRSDSEFGDSFTYFDNTKDAEKDLDLPGMVTSMFPVKTVTFELDWEQTNPQTIHRHNGGECGSYSTSIQKIIPLKTKVCVTEEEKK